MILCQPQYADIIAAYPLMFQKMIQDYEWTCKEYLQDIVVVHSAGKDWINFYYPKKSGFNGVDYLLDQINSRWFLDKENREFDVLSIAQPDDVDTPMEGLLELRYKSTTTYQRG